MSIITFLCHNKQQHDAAWQLALDFKLRPLLSTNKGYFNERSNVCLDFDDKSVSAGHFDWPQTNTLWKYGTIVDLGAPVLRIDGIPYYIKIEGDSVKVGCQTFDKATVLSLARAIK